MKKGLIILLALMVFGIAGNASALILTDTVDFYSGGVSGGNLDGYGWGTVNKIDGFGDFVSWTHTYDFNPEVASINSASFSVSLRDDNDWWLEYAWGWTEGIGWDYLGEIDYGQYNLDVNLGWLLNEEYSASISSSGGDFYVKKAVLTVDYAPVPEPATLLLLGSGLAGLALYRRKRMK